MAIAMPIRDHVTPDRMKRWTKFLVAGFVTALLGGFFAAYFTAGFQRDINNEAALQQQNLAALQSFVSSGAELDASITVLADTVVDQSDETSARKEVRVAIAEHASASEGLKPIVGSTIMNQYMEGLGTLRDFVDRADDPKSMMDASQARFDIMANRQIIIREARKDIYQ